MLVAMVLRLLAADQKNRRPTRPMSAPASPVGDTRRRAVECVRSWCCGRRLVVHGGVELPVVQSAEIVLSLSVIQ